MCANISNVTFAAVLYLSLLRIVQAQSDNPAASLLPWHASCAETPGIFPCAGMFPVEIHTVGRVHYMLVEGLEEAMRWADAIRAQTGDAIDRADQDVSNLRSSMKLRP